MAYSEKIVMSIGGSLIVPDEGIDTKFLSNLNAFIRGQLAKYKNRQFFLVAGGGKTTRLYAHLLRTIFRDIAHPFIIKHYDIIRKPTESVIVAAGWKPGASTDYDSVLLCEDYNVRSIINLTNIQTVYDKDPKKNKNAKPIDKISWPEFRKLVGDKWIPGL